MRWAALVVAVAVVLVSRSYFGDGAVAHLLQRRRDARLERQVATLLASLPAPTAAPAPAPAGAATPTAPARPLPALGPVTDGDGSVLLGAPFERSQPGAGTTPFTRVDAEAAGFMPPAVPRPYLALEPGVMHLGALAAGDVDSDGWPDVAVGTHAGVVLYRNTGGAFAPQSLDFPPMRDWITGDVALVDLDGDAALDLFFSTWMHGSHVLFNRDGAFSGADHAELPRGSETAAHASAFADVDRDGDVDVVTGATTHVPRFFHPVPAVNRVWYSDGRGRFRPEDLPGPHGETLTLLFHDVDGDGWDDLIVGNDYDEPDRLYRNDHGTLRPVTADANPIGQSTYDTMSVDAGDIDNDGTDELYIGGIGDAGDNRPVVGPLSACGVYDDTGERSRCEALARFQIATVSAYRTETVAPCTQLADATQQRDCLVSSHHWNRVLTRLPARGADKPEILSECAKVPGDFVVMRDICGALTASPLDHEQSHTTLAGEQPQIRGTNLLYARDANGYRDVTQHWGAGFPGWTWNAKFADLDNDGWQDLFVAEGSRLRPDGASASLFHNQRGQGFRDVAPAAGLTDHNPTGASLFVDVDVDGDLDLVTYPFLLTPVLWRNDAPAGAGLEIGLDDRSADNRQAIGARVEIRSADGRTQVRTIKASGGYQSHDALVARFGLGDWPAVAAVRVTWPDGQRSHLDGLRLTAGRYRLERER